MNLPMKKKSAWHIILTILFWLCVQVCVIIALEILGLQLSRLFHIGLYGIQGSVAGMVYTIACCVVGLVYTIVGSVILEKVPINTKRWWTIVGCCYVLFMILTAAGMLMVQGAWFWEGYGAFLLDVWLAPLLWLGEIELFYFCLLSKTKKGLSQ